MSWILPNTPPIFTPGRICFLPPYTAYMQGGLTYEYGKLGVMRALDEMLK